MTDSVRNGKKIGMRTELADGSVCPTLTHKDLRSKWRRRFRLRTDVFTVVNIQSSPC